MRLTKTPTGASSSCLPSNIAIDLVAHTKCAWHDLKSYRQASNDFAVKLDCDSLIFLPSARDDLSCERVAYFIHAQVRAKVQTRRVGENSESACIANRDYIE